MRKLGRWLSKVIKGERHLRPERGTEQRSGHRLDPRFFAVMDARKEPPKRRK